MSDDESDLLRENRGKTRAALRLIAASLDAYAPFDPAAELSPKQLEPYDALADRFIRAVESALRLFRSVEIHEFGVPADSTREMLDRMEKLRWVSSADLWMAMRSIRNKIVHDYLPEQVARMFAQIAGPFAAELRALDRRLDAANRTSAS
jgi:uncharacterized protein YutE (UPF0331/DUF86 family)